MVYLITFACYGGHLHGGESGSVDREHNAPETPILTVDSMRPAFEAELMNQAPYRLDQIRHDAVLEAIQEVCVHRGWVHTVVEAEVPPERVMGDFKAYASRRLNGMRLDEPNRKRWAHHTSRRPYSMSSPGRVTP
ncbi:MAG: hypothetical protein P4L56_28615 [Candidatus Sulfopaludibacter sp.]|nr:hypothetical protein [Candidatus Sulfopaludibacter sp.]